MLSRAQQRNLNAKPIILTLFSRIPHKLSTESKIFSKYLNRAKTQGGPSFLESTSNQQFTLCKQTHQTFLSHYKVIAYETQRIDCNYCFTYRYLPRLNKSNREAKNKDNYSNRLFHLIQGVLQIKQK